jgi:hypothetical protein
MVRNGPKGESVMKKHVSVWGIGALAAGVVVAGLAQVALAKGIQSNATLVGSAAFPAAKGNARFRAQLGAASGSLTVTVENGPPGATVNVSVGGTSVGTIALAPGPVNPGNGTATFTVPSPVAGKMITVTTADGTLVVSGTLQ